MKTIRNEASEGEGEGGGGRRREEVKGETTNEWKREKKMKEHLEM